MKIGIDIDGVLTDVEQWQLDYASKFYYEKYQKEIVNFEGYETNQIFNMKSEIDEEFWNMYFKEYSMNVPIRKFANEVIDRLKQDGHQIYIITARGSFLSHSSTIMSIEENKKIVLDWLKSNNISYDKIIFSLEDKLDICRDNNIDLMIEDKPYNINKISQIIPVICFHANYNKKCKKTNIIRCYSWYDIYSKICNLSA